MIIFLYGKDSFRVQQKAKEIISGYFDKNKSGVNLVFLDENISFKQIKNQSGQVAMFEEKRLFVGKDLLKGQEDEFLKNLRGISENENILLLQEEEVKESVVKKLKEDKSVMIQKFDRLKGKRLNDWYRREIENKEGVVEKDALETLITLVGDDLWRAHNEINKLISFAEDKSIEKEDVLKMVRGKEDADIFKAIDLLGLGKKDEAVKILEVFLRRGDTPLYLLSMINYQLRNLILIKTLSETRKTREVLKESGLPYFVAKKSYAQSENFSLEKLKKIYQKLLRVDLEIKTGVIKGETGLTFLLSEF